MAGEKFLGKNVVLRNGDLAFVSRKGHTGKSILVGIYQGDPFTWFDNGFWRLDGPEKEENQRPWDIVEIKD